MAVTGAYFASERQSPAHLARQARARAGEFEAKAQQASDPREAAYWQDLARIEVTRAKGYEAAH